MPQANLNDLAPLRRLACFALGLSGAVVGGIALMRIGLPTQWAVPGVAWLMLCTALLAPLAVIERLPPSIVRWPRDLLAGPAVIAGLVVVWLLGFLGTVGLLLIALGALAGIAAALKAELPTLRPGRLLVWMVLVLLLSVPLICVLDGVKYGNFIADRLMLFGRADGDTLFHAALLNALRYHGVTSTGIDGVPPFSYHIGAHLLAGRIASLAGGDAVSALIALRAVLTAPLVLFAIAAGGIVWGRRRGAVIDRTMLAAIGAFVVSLGAGSLNLGVAGLNSESAVLAVALLLLAFPAFLLAATGEGLGRLGWAAALLLIVPLSAAKISFGFVWGGTVAWWALRKLGLRRPAFWVVAVAGLLLFGICFHFFNAGGDSGAVLFGKPYYFVVIRHGDYLAPLVNNILGFAVMAILWTARRASDMPQGDVPMGGRRARDAVETLAVVFVLANLPGLLMNIPGGDAIYFIITFGWAVQPLLNGEILRQAELRNAGRARTVARAVGVVVVVACIVGLVINDMRYARLIINTEALVRSGDTQYYADNRARTLRAGAKHARKHLGLSGIFTAPPAPAPAEPLVEMLKQFRETAGNDGALYVPPSLAAFWSLTQDCDGKSMLPMAAAGVPMLNGYYPDQAACEQEFALSGTPGVPADIATPLDDAAICARAAAVHARSVLVLTELAPEPQTRTLSCAQP